MIKLSVALLLSNKKVIDNKQAQADDTRAQYSSSKGKEARTQRLNIPGTLHPQLLRWCAQFVRLRRRDDTSTCVLFALSILFSVGVLCQSSDPSRAVSAACLVGAPSFICWLAPSYVPTCSARWGNQTVIKTLSSF